MTQFTTLLRLALVPEDSSSGPASPIFLYADDFTFQPVPSDSDGGLSWLCDKTFVIETPSSDVLATFSRPRPSILTLKSTDGQTYRIGTPTIPATCYISRHLQRSQLFVSCTMLRNPLA